MCMFQFLFLILFPSAVCFPLSWQHNSMNSAMMWRSSFVEGLCSPSPIDSGRALVWVCSGNGQRRGSQRPSDRWETNKGNEQGRNTQKYSNRWANEGNEQGRGSQWASNGWANEGNEKRRESRRPSNGWVNQENDQGRGTRRPSNGWANQVPSSTSDKATRNPSQSRRTSEGAMPGSAQHLWQSRLGKRQSESEESVDGGFLDRQMRLIKSRRSGAAKPPAAPSKSKKVGKKAALHEGDVDWDLLGRVDL